MTLAVAVAPKLHSELGASIAGRWMACPGSVQLVRQVPVPPTTAFAEEGTAAHALAELVLRRAGRDPLDYVGTRMENGVEVSEEMAEHVRVFTDHCLSLTQGECEWWVERKFSLGELAPPGPMFGTADFVSLDHGTGVLHVVDLKYGMGVGVEATGNKQLRYYALGALLSLPDGSDVDKVVMTIVQPRKAHHLGMIRSDELLVEDLLAFSVELLDAARATTVPDAPLHAGSHCRFCPAAGVCPEQFRQAQAVAQMEFSDLPADVPPAPETLPEGLFLELLPKLDVLEDWIAAMRGHARGRLDRGEVVPGWKLVAKRATRRWTDEGAVRQLLEARGLDESEYLETKLKSPAQVEKVVKKKNMPTEFVSSVSSGTNMVPADDPREEVLVTRGEEFLALPVGDE